MSHTKHELSDEFPDHVEKISELNQSNAHFAKLSAEYHDLNRAVHRAETDVEPTDDQHMQQMRKERLALKDQIWTILSA